MAEVIRTMNNTLQACLGPLQLGAGGTSSPGHFPAPHCHGNSGHPWAAFLSPSCWLWSRQELSGLLSPSSCQTEKERGCLWTPLKAP